MQQLFNLLAMSDRARSQSGQSFQQVPAAHQRQNTKGKTATTLGGVGYALLGDALERQRNLFKQLLIWE